jgi:hypothetical protein
MALALPQQCSPPGVTAPGRRACGAARRIRHDPKVTFQFRARWLSPLREGGSVSRNSAERSDVAIVIRDVRRRP